jgi:hypothetical protein
MCHNFLQSPLKMLHSQNQLICEFHECVRFLLREMKHSSNHSNVT